MEHRVCLRWSAYS